MNNNDIYWNHILETLPYERLRQLQLKKFRRIVDWAYNNSPFYKKLYRDSGFEPGDLKKFEDIQKIPKTDKGMLRDVQKRPPFPYGDILSVPIEDVTTFRQTSGTTGTPVYQADTWQDWEWWSECWSYILYAQGYRDTDRVFIPFGYNIFVAFWAGHYAAEKIGCEVVPGGVLNTEARILKMQELKCTAFMATPTYVLALAETATKMGIDPIKDLFIRRITCAGEPGASIPATKKRIEDAWGCKVYDHIGATEIGAWSYECTSQPGGLHVNDAFFLVEIEDIETGKIVDEPGKNGKMIITAFDRLGKPCIRFDSKDVIRWADYTCECGRTFRMIDGGVIGRADDITKVKGVLLAPTAIEEVVRSFPELGDEYEVVVSKAGDVDDILLKIEMSSWHAEKKDLILARLQDQLRLKTNLGYRIEVRPLGSLPRYQVKAHRFKDLRKKEGSH
ncbi:MAG TPA: AMP-binding protein [Syntrophorhabdaceae bacterium]|nr:AMP-binding protein [Syntrophorhabdaceae bacterium]HQM82969.1 AMP-binding protein [Syntrophorhabdaceae bacterium]